MVLRPRRLVFFALACGCCLPACALPSFGEVRAAYVESDAVLLARDGRPLSSKRVDMAQRRLPWTAIEDVSPTLLRALLASEDRNFYAHAGVDWGAAAASAWRNLWATKTRGASTLSMQLVGLLEDYERGAATRRGRRNVAQKLTQAGAALWLEQRWRKEQILEAYLNLVSFRGELVGVAAMSRGLFGKWPDGLDEREAAIAAALLRSPGALRDPVGGWLGVERSPNLAPHLAHKLLTHAGERLRSTLDADLQRFASAALRDQLRAIARQRAEDGALLVIDNASGDVLAWVGSSGDLSRSPEVDGASALRQAGSTLKPFLYALAIERRVLTAASLIDDSPLTLDTGNGLYAPQDYSPEFRGWVSARLALGGSLNVPAVRTLVRVGPDALRDRLRAFGFKSLTESGDYYGYSLALGSADVSLLMLANAYRTLANGGAWTPLRVAGGRVPCDDGGCRGVFTGAPQRASPPAPAFIVSDILADRAARVGTFGLESWLATPYWSAVKTGTSKDMRDNWCVGFTPRHTVAVWVGNAAGEAMHDVSGVSGAAPVWREVMDWLSRGERTPPAIASPANTPPAGVVRQSIRFEPPGRIGEAARQEWFLSGTERRVVRLAENGALARIAYPGPGTIIALDPDIPPARQRVALQLSGAAGAGWQWRIDGQRVGAAKRGAHWLPRPGRHRLALVDGQGGEIEALDFEVRALRGRVSAAR